MVVQTNEVRAGLMPFSACLYLRTYGETLLKPLVTFFQKLENNTATKRNILASRR
jgi:hypothetical protein